jgi:glycosyltransferase involved in cell wall biosynthesis
MSRRVIYVAAHADWPDTEPLGGGKAVADYLIREWRTAKPFQLTVLSPKSLGLPATTPLTDLSELAYARFCRQFERATTAAIRQHSPDECVVLTNDISEGPDFATLGAHGYRVASIWHVDVVEYFTRFYLRNLVAPTTLARLNSFGWLPDVLRLVFEKQRRCVEHSARLIVPSAPMRDLIRRCYPFCPEERISVLPWGNIAPPVTIAPAPASTDEFVILTLSRLSPEKGIERLLAALPLVTGHQLRVVVAGAPAYMSGRRYERKLRRQAARLPCPVEFTGHVTGKTKAALLQRADLFVSPSLHESYGLTIAEAEAVGCPVISHQHHGARGEIVDCADPRQLAAVIQNAITRGRQPRTTVPAQSAAAVQLAVLLAGPEFAPCKGLRSFL